MKLLDFYFEKFIFIGTINDFSAFFIFRRSLFTITKVMLVMEQTRGNDKITYCLFDYLFSRLYFLGSTNLTWAQICTSWANNLGQLDLE